jgi:predicted ArsR family transcriptional regulator
VVASPPARAAGHLPTGASAPLVTRLTALDRPQSRHGPGPKGYATPVEGETTYTIDEAAEILGETPGRVQEMLVSGELEGIPPGATVSGEWKVLLPTSTGEDPGQEAPAEEGGEQFVEPPASSTEAEELPAETEELSRGDTAAASAEPTAPSGWVSTQQAARALGISPRTVRWHIEQGNLEAKPEGEGVRRTWLVSIDSLHALRDARQAAGGAPRGYRAPTEGADIAAESSGEAIRMLAERLEDAAARAAEYRVRLELTEQAASSVRAELDEERRRREAAERERDDLRRQLESRPAPRETPPASTAVPERVEPRPEPRPPPVAPQRGSRRRALWRRVFGG